MMRVESDYFFIDLTVFPGSGCSMVNRPSILAVALSLYVVFPATVRVSDVWIKEVVMIDHQRQSLGAARKNRPRKFQIEFPSSGKIRSLNRSALAGQ
jgi:hypothetical protein